MLAFGVRFPQPCSSDGRRFAASRSRLTYYRIIGSFRQERIEWNVLQIGLQRIRTFVLTKPNPAILNTRESPKSLICKRSPRHSKEFPEIPGKSGVFNIWSPPRTAHHVHMRNPPPKSMFAAGGCSRLWHLQIWYWHCQSHTCYPVLQSHTSAPFISNDIMPSTPTPPTFTQQLFHDSLYFSSPIFHCFWFISLWFDIFHSGFRLTGMLPEDQILWGIILIKSCIFSSEENDFPEPQLASK